MNLTTDKSQNLRDLAQANFQTWNGALLTKDRQIVADLYADDASFLPTLNGELKQGRSGAEDYFEHFLQKNPSGRIVEECVQATAYDAEGRATGFLHSGLYDFEVGTEETRQTVAARFTFLWQLDASGTWKIIHHHSSLKP